MKQVPIPLLVFLHGLKVCVTGQDLTKMLNLKGMCPRTSQNVIEGFRAKRAYVMFWAHFYFLQDRANFWQTDLF